MPRKVEIFSAGCPVCEETVQWVRQRACPDCEVTVLSLQDGSTADRARQMGIRSVPAVMVDGALVECCAGRGPEEEALKGAGIGQPLSEG
ncbi:MAG: hypothetical protein GWM98_03790 [Nitrospinaceae bacterium]|nr:hypothetical protein [Nitrospinaceae bacterium]NIR53790.1 hypothetical protein [Nitrospinaceae bacterium]NIS84200.1 hypothetical protein [Nitrospinaceae bacterium]NIT81006.1 hypothetical protein [Nitrospinaceae bacterium]NIU43296.1 hypothetical protein [Nitrospinaceae bacterium]